MSAVSRLQTCDAGSPVFYRYRYSANLVYAFSGRPPEIEQCTFGSYEIPSSCLYVYVWLIGITYLDESLGSARNIGPFTISMSTLEFPVPVFVGMPLLVIMVGTDLARSDKSPQQFRGLLI